MTDVYKKLAQHLEKTVGGFPPTDTGIELKILKQLFNEEEAMLAASLTMLPETVDAIANRIDDDPQRIEPILQNMGKKGLIIHVQRNGQHSYMTVGFVIGIWEYQVNNLSEQLISDFNEYIPYLSKDMFKNKTQQLRVVPVSKSISTDMNVMDYEEAENIIKAQSKIIVAPCICRKEHEIMGKGCDKPQETCFVFSGGAYLYESRNIGREVTQEEALKILHGGIEKGLVVQPSNAKKPINICLCCSCCCQILKNLKEYETPGKIISSNYYAKVEKDNCTGCEACTEICPMEAIKMEDDSTAFVNEERCIGCGLCVTSCEFDSMHMIDKDPSDKIEPPQSIVDTYMTIFKEKGLM